MTGYRLIPGVSLSDALCVLCCVTPLLALSADPVSADCPIPPPSEVTEALVAAEEENPTVGLEQCGLCVCDVDNTGRISAVDALHVLRSVVRLPATLSCPAHNTPAQ